MGNNTKSLIRNLSGYKRCTKCNEWKPESDFYTNNKLKDKLTSQCKQCLNINQKQYCQDNREKKALYMKEYYQDNKEKYINYQHDNKENIVKRKKQYHQDNKEQRSNYMKQYNQDNKDQRANYMKQHNKSLALYSTYAHQLKYAEKVRKDPNNLKLLQVKCTYCGKWHNPLNRGVTNRLLALNNSSGNENNLYCSDNCKLACPTYGKQKYPKGFKKSTSREVQPELRKLVLARDNYTCQKCGAIDKELHCHHITGVAQNPIESADMDNCITFCKECHKFIHTLPDCSYYELRCVNE